MYRQAGKNHASCLTSLDADLTEVMLENDTATTEIYTRTYTLSLHDAHPISDWQDEIVQTAFITNNNISITGASPKHSFYLGDVYKRQGTRYIIGQNNRCIVRIHRLRSKYLTQLLRD